MKSEERLSKGPCNDRLKGKVALVTGAGGGQGQVIARIFAEAGATVFASDINSATIETTRILAKQHGLSIHTATVDASSVEQVAEWVNEAVAKAGRIDILYNNGAAVHMAPFSEMTHQQWSETIRLELDVIFAPTKAVWPIMTRQQGGALNRVGSSTAER